MAGMTWMRGVLSTPGGSVAGSGVDRVKPTDWLASVRLTVAALRRDLARERLGLRWRRAVGT